MEGRQKAEPVKMLQSCPGQDGEGVRENGQDIHEVDQ